MPTEPTLDEQLEQHRSLRNRLPNAWNAFFARFGSLRPVQLQTIPRVLAQENVLVTAPTAGGKTEAVIAPLCELMIGRQWRGLSVLLIAPTRALVNDLYHRLASPCDQMKIRLGRKTADHAITERVEEQLLITTPESTESLLTFSRQRLNCLRAVVLDEIHLLDGSPRGDQLRVILRRLETYLNHAAGQEFVGLQKLAMSATVPNPARIAKVYLGASASVVHVAGQREVQAHTIVASGDERDRAHAAMEALDAFDDVRKILVFVNSRKQVDVAAGHFQHGLFSAVPVYGHHGNLSKWQREDAESRFKSDARAICVATMTLEVGIDIGDVDLVICMDPPFSLSSFLQRIGRGCRRLNGRTRVLCVARNRASELMFHAMIRQAVIGLPAGPVPPFRRSVAVQQTLAYLRQVDKHRRTLDQFLNVLSSSENPPITRELVTDLLADMVLTDLLAAGAGFYEPASAGWDFITSNRIYSNIQPAPIEVSLVDADTGRPVATIAGLGRDPSGVRVAGRSYKVLPGGSAFRQKVRRGGDHAESPEYHARSLPYAFDVGASLAAFLAIPNARLAAVRIGDNTVVMTWLGRLMNAAVAAGIRRQSRNADEKSFSLRLPDANEGDILPLLREAVNTVCDTNPIGAMTIEHVADLGPHFRELSQDAQRMAREDWLDRDFLRAWIMQIEAVQFFSPDDVFGQDLIELSKV